MTLNIMRALCALSVQDQGQQLLTKALARLYHDFWVQHAEISKPEVYEQLLKDVLGEQVAAKGLSDAASTGKVVLKENTDKAFKDGAFGIPWMVCTNSSGQTESFWGVDHLGQILHFLGIEKPSRGGWKAVL